MFRRKKDNEDDTRPLMSEPDSGADLQKVPARTASAPAAAAGAIPPRNNAMPVASARPAIAPTPAPRPAAIESESKKLIVGRDIMLSGKITSCDKLVVEGRVEAELSETRAIEISENGFFKGTAEIESAEIAGRYEGTITIRQRLFIRATGKISGTIRYGTVEIEAGGEISGDVQVSGTQVSSTQVSGSGSD